MMRWALFICSLFFIWCLVDFAAYRLNGVTQVQKLIVVVGIGGWFVGLTAKFWMRFLGIGGE